MAEKSEFAKKIEKLLDDKNDLNTMFQYGAIAGEAYRTNLLLINKQIKELTDGSPGELEREISASISTLFNN